MNTDTPTTSGIYAAMAAIMGEVSPIAKGQRNNEQKFQYRGIDDVYNALNPLMAQHRVFMVPTVTARTTDERTTKSGNTMSCVTLTVEYRFFHADGSSITCTVMGEGRDTADKATNKAMAAAHKYALLQTFCIPTADVGRDDPDHETPEPLVPRPPVRLDLAAIQRALAGFTDVKEMETYWPKVRVQENHPDYAQLANLFVARKKALFQATPTATASQAAPVATTQQAAPAPSQPAPTQPVPTQAVPTQAAKPHITLAAARSAFNECKTPTELEACARRLAIAKDNPEHGAIAQAYKERGKMLSAQAAPPEAPPSPEQSGTPSDSQPAQPGMISPDQIKAIQAAYSGWSREDRLMDISERVGRPINSVKELSLAEAIRLLEALSRAKAAA